MCSPLVATLSLIVELASTTSSWQVDIGEAQRIAEAGRHRVHRSGGSQPFGLHVMHRLLG